jgi:hypothetical protein
MLKTDIVKKTNSSTLLNDFVKYASNELGDVKVRDIVDKVNKSDKVRKFLFEANINKYRLGSDNFLGCIHSSVSFTFAKAETISIATILVLEKWNTLVNIPNQIADSDYIKEIFFRIIDKCDGFKLHLDSTQNFFARFYTYLENGFTKVVADKNDPYFWIITAIDAIAFYKIGFDRDRPVWDDYAYNVFILNCSLIYYIEFPNEIDQIGWDDSNPKKNLFNELVLKITLDFIKKRVNAIKIPFNEDVFADKDEVDSCLKFFATALTQFSRNRDVDAFRMITYNVYNSIIVKEFKIERISNDAQFNDLAGKFEEALEFIGNKLI